MVYIDNYIRIFAIAFEMEDERIAHEYRITLEADSYRLNHILHDANVWGYLSDWKFIANYSNLFDAMREVFDQLRTKELTNGLYKQITYKELPSRIYDKKINQWVDYANRLEMKTFFIHGNHSKYAQPSEDTKLFYLRYYEDVLKVHKQSPSITDLWFGELVKKELSLVNQKLFIQDGFNELNMEDFLYKYYVDYIDQIDRYFIDIGKTNKSRIVNSENRKQIEYNFEHCVHTDDYN